MHDNINGLTGIYRSSKVCEQATGNTFIWSNRELTELLKCLQIKEETKLLHPYLHVVKLWPYYVALYQILCYISCSKLNGNNIKF